MTSKYTRVSTWLVLSLLISGLAIRILALDAQSLTMDECVEREIARMPIAEVIHFGNSFPPAYSLLAKAALAVHDGLVVTRLLSVVFGLALLATLYFSLRTFENRTVAWFVTLCGSVSPFVIFYSLEGRAYMLYFLLAGLAIWLAMRLADHGKASDYFWFILVGVIGGYVHYFFSLVLVAVFVAACVVHGIAGMKRLVIAGIVIGLCCLPLLLLVGNDFHFQRDLRVPRPMSIASVGYTLFSYFSGYSLGPSQRELHVLSGSQAAKAALPWLLVTFVFVGPLFLLGLPRSFSDRKGISWVCLLLIPFTLVGLSTVFLGLTFNPRFLVWLWIPTVVVVARGWNAVPNRLQVISALGLAVVSAAALINRYHVDSYRNEDAQAVIEFVHRQTDAGPVAVIAGYMNDPLKAHNDKGIELIRILDLSDPNGSLEIAGDQLQGLAATGPYFLAYSRPFHGDPAGELLEAANPTGAEPVFTTAGFRVFLCNEKLSAGE